MTTKEAINYGKRLREQATEMCQEGSRGSILIEDCDKLNQFLDVVVYEMKEISEEQRMKVKDIIKNLSPEDLERDIIVTENEIIFRDKPIKGKLSDCKDGTCSITFTEEA